MKTVSLIALALLAIACEPDWTKLTEGTLPTCEYVPLEDKGGTVPAGECWRAVAVASSAAVRFEDESCSAARECLVGTEGQTIVPMVGLMTSATNDSFEVIAWPCDEIEGACL
jgi:hypothetical protein